MLNDVDNRDHAATRRVLDGDGDGDGDDGLYSFFISIHVIIAAVSFCSSF